MPDTKRALKVFLCHASADKTAVRELYKRLTADGVDAWLDAESLVPGQKWLVEIPKAIRESDVVIVCLSERSVNKEGYIQKEIKFALDVADEKPEGTIFIIPARLEECKTPDRLNEYQWVDLFETNGYQRLMSALRIRADNTGLTLHIKRSWLPKVNTQPTNIKKPSTPIEKSVEIKQERPKPKKAIQAPKAFNKTIIGIAIFFVFAIAAVLGLPPLIGKPEPTPAATSAASSKTFTPIPATKTQILTSTPTQVLTITPTPLPAEITDAKGVEMALVPDGEFMMGPDPAEYCENSTTWPGCEEYYKEYIPVHRVFLDVYYIDKYEVTNALYQICVQAGVCRNLTYNYISSETTYYGNSLYDNYPVVWINWDMANSYCIWRGARLPTEAEWEKAARGVDGRIYPWGNDFDSSRVNFCGKECPSFYYSQWMVTTQIFSNGYNITAPVDSYSNGVSPYGVYNLAGNVSEWVADWYQGDYYTTIGEYSVNPQGPSNGKYRVIRGGDWHTRYFVNEWLRLDAVMRDNSPPNNIQSYIGFRCARTP